jgi:hypothetical protein
MGPMIYFTRIDFIWDWRRKFSTRLMVKVYWWLHCHAWVTGSHICTAVPWRSSLGQTALETNLVQHFYVPKLSSISKTVCERCSVCARNDLWYLLVFACTSSEWIKAFPTRTEKVPVKENHPSNQNTCIYWIRQQTGLCDWGATVNG